MEEYDDPSAIRVTKLIAQRGVASRREAERLVEQGAVMVNGTVIREVVPVNPAVDRVLVFGKPLPREPHKAWYMLYKPRGYVTSHTDPKERRTVMELVAHLPVRVEPVGRLDLDSEGVLLFTNDGETAHALLHPSRQVPKRYLAKVYRIPSEAKLEAIRKGRVHLEDGPVPPSLVRVVEITEDGNAWVELTVTEGRNRLVRRLFQQLHHPVSKLRRVSFATIALRDMERGQVRALTGDEIARLQQIAQGVSPQRAGHKRKKAGFAVAKPKTRVQARKKSTVRKVNR